MDIKEEKEVEKAKELIEKFDPALVSIAMQEIDIKAEDLKKAKEGIRKTYDSIATEPPQQKRQVLSKAVAEIRAEVINEEIDRIKVALKGINTRVLVEAWKGLEIKPWLCFEDISCRGACIQVMVDRGAYCFEEIHCRSSCVQVMHVTDTKLCIDDIGDCGFCINMMNIFDSIDPGAMIVVDGRYAGGVSTNGRFVSKAPIDERYAGVVITNGYFGNVALCFESPLVCSGRSVTVMSNCASGLVALDIGGTINPVDAILKVAESHPELHKRITRMVGKMREAHEL